MKLLYSLFCLLIFPIIVSASANGIDSLDIPSYIAHHQLDAKDDGNGIFYSFEKKGKGVLPKPGDYVKINYIGKMLDGSAFDQSDPNDPFVFRVGYRIVIQGWDKGIQKLPVGSKASLLVPAEMAYGSSGLGEVPPNTPLLYELEVLDILSPDAYDQYVIQVEKKERAAYKKHVSDQFKKDKRLINDYAADQKLRVKRTEKGVSYAIKKKGKGDNLKRGDKVTIHYEGMLLDGTKFDSSYDRKTPFTFILGHKKVIEGWEDALVNFKKGSKGVLLIPSKMAYGRLAIREEGINIPGDSALIFNVEVVGVE